MKPATQIDTANPRAHTATIAEQIKSFAQELAETDLKLGFYNEEYVAQRVEEILGDQHAKLVAALRETRHTLEVLLTCDHCAGCEYCNSHKIARKEIAAINAALANEPEGGE